MRADAESRPGGFWPTAEQQLLLRVAFGPSPLASWRELRPQLDLDRLDRGSMAAVPLVWRALRDAGEDDPLLPRLRGIYRHSWTTTHLVLRHLPRLLDALQAAAVDALLVGAAPRALVAYRDIGLRRIDRLKLLVAPADLARALEATLAAGWRAPAGGVDPARPIVLAGHCKCALHSRLLREFPPAASDESDLDYLRGAAATTSYADREVVVTGRTDDLLLVLLGGPQPRQPPSILWLLDALTLLACAPHELDWQRLLERARRLHGLLRLRDGLGYLAGQLGASVPSDVLDELARATPARRERVAHRARSRWWPLLGPFPEPLARYLRSSGDERLLDVLRDTWGVESRVRVTRAALGRVGVRLREARTL